MQNSRRQFLKSLSVTSLGLASGLINLNACSSNPQPNILWIIGEDVSQDLNCYGEHLAHTPNLDKLAMGGMRFTNAFTTAPVCSASRSALMTGMYQTSIGAHNHRSHRDDNYQLPIGVNVITKYFREAGYFTANIKTAAPGIEGTVKTDWNFSFENPFDGDDWNQRREGQPFFAQVNFPEAHRIFKKSESNPINPADVKLPPYYPDHPITREDWALYLDTIKHLDNKVGAILKRLENEGLSDNTIVFFFGDHGRAMPRAKQWLYDPGIRIPLIIRWPGHIKAGAVNENLISAIDITATSMKIAGIPFPEKLEGRDFLGNDASNREYIIAARDRCDETVDRIRCVRTKKFKYIKNFFPERPYLQLNRYKETEYPTLRLMRRLHLAGKLNSDQEKFLASTRPPEELYDIQNDPFELNNLAANPEFNDTLTNLREILINWIKKTGDKGEIPEDPEVPQKYLKKMQDLYDERIKKLYEQEGMVLLPEMIQ